MTDVTIQGLYCGTVQRVTYEVFGYDRGSWLRIKETDCKIEAQECFHNPDIRKAYQNRIAWSERTVIETRSLKGAMVPIYQLVMKLRPEEFECEEREIVRRNYSDLIEGMEACQQARKMNEVEEANLIDLSTGRSVHCGTETR
jgi:hypothetical protein